MTPFKRIVIFNITLLYIWLETAGAVTIEPKGKAIAKALGTKKAFRKKVELDGKKSSFYYSKDSSGKAKMLAFIEKGLFPPNCTHTWVVGVDAKTAKVKKIRVVEMKCPHAFPTKKASFLDQYKGKGPADVQKLDKNINTIAKATASCELMTKAVKRSIRKASKLKGKI